MNNGKTYAKKIILGLIVIVLLIFVLMFTKGCRTSNIQAELTIEALSSTLKKTIDKNGIETAEKRLILLDYKTLKKLHASDSSEIGRLQKIVNRYTLSATIVNTTTKGTLTGHSVNVTFGNKADSLPKLTNEQSEAFGFPCDTIYPTYTDTLRDKWSDIAVAANKDSISVIYSVKNEFEFTQEYTKEGRWPFRKSVPVVKVRSLNPNTTTTGISSYAVPTKSTGKKVAGIGAIMLGLGFIAGAILTR